MACQLTIYDPVSKKRDQYTCDEENAGRVVVDDHAAAAAGQYQDVSGKAFQVDWKQSRLVSFARKQ
jgi:hypothetical protein